MDVGELRARLPRGTEGLVHAVAGGEEVQVPARGRWAHHPDWLDAKAAIAIVIGLVSFSGALVTWRASALSSNATSADRRSILETVALEQQRQDFATYAGIREGIEVGTYKNFDFFRLAADN